jgi:hypothetical protein
VVAGAGIARWDATILFLSLIIGRVPPNAVARVASAVRADALPGGSRVQHGAGARLGGTTGVRLSNLQQVGLSKQGSAFPAALVASAQTACASCCCQRFNQVMWECAQRLQGIRQVIGQTDFNPVSYQRFNQGMWGMCSKTARNTPAIGPTFQPRLLSGGRDRSPGSPSFWVTW